uniref:Uncharacterized protein n=1 Tax=Acrobeloides nanus TaxID=290746 RepID=A0A914EE75_9BILA
MVRTVDGKHIRMDELTLEDWVLSPNKTKMIYTPMETWIHRLPSAYTNFIKFTLENGKMLKITNKHFIYKTTCDSNLKSISIEDLPIQPVYAEKVEVDDCLYVVDKYNKNYKMSQSKVVKKEHVYEKGLYAPMTVTSDIVVNDIVASCYNIINHREMQFSFFHNVKKLASWSRLLYGETNEDLDIPLATSFLVDLLQYILPNSIIPS